jgi:hypothetical protein
MHITTTFLIESILNNTIYLIKTIQIMKKAILLVAIAAVFGLKGYSQFSFGVAPGLSTNSAYFGYKAGKVVPYVGFQFANARINLDMTGMEWDGASVVSFSNEMKISGSLYVPTLGIKFFAIEKNKLKAYFNLSVAKPFIRAKVEDNGTEIEEINDVLKEIKLIGGEFGFGVEYFFDDNFSVGGEFGIRYMHGKYSNTYEEEVYNGTDMQLEEFEDTYNIGLMPTYSKFSLNFYFGGGSAE